MCGHMKNIQKENNEFVEMTETEARGSLEPRQVSFLKFDRFETEKSSV